MNAQNFPTSVRYLRQGFAQALDKVELQQRALGGASFTADTPIVGSLGIWSCEYEFTLETWITPIILLFIRSSHF